METRRASDRRSALSVASRHRDRDGQRCGRHIQTARSIRRRSDKGNAVSRNADGFLDADGRGFQRVEERRFILEKANELVAKYDKDYPLRFYSREYLFSDEARADFVEGDLRKLFRIITVSEN